MSLRLFIPGLALLVAAAFSCENQGRGVGTDVVDELCALNREAVSTLHSEEGMAFENDTFKYTYCDNSTDLDGDGIGDVAEVQGACKALQPGDLDNIEADCKRNGIRAILRCQSEMEALLACMKAELDNADSRVRFYTQHFNCWSDKNGNGQYDAGVYWTIPEDGSRPESDLNHPETCESTLLLYQDRNPLKRTFGDTGTHLSCGTSPGLNAQGAVEQKYNRCYFLKELPRNGDETVAYNNVTFQVQKATDPVTKRPADLSPVCTDEYLALNRCTKEPLGFLGMSSSVDAAGSPSQ